MTQRQPILRPLALAGILALAAGTVWAAGFFWLETLVEGLVGPKKVYRSVTVTSEGVPLVELRKADERGRITYQTLEGKPVARDKVPETRHPAASFGGLSMPRPSWLSRLIGLGPFRDVSEYWYFVHNGRIDGAGYFVAYDMEAAFCKGYLGVKGFRSTKPPLEDQFPVDGRLVASGSALAGVSASYGFQPSGGYDETFSPAWNVGSSHLHSAFLLSQNRLLEVDLQKRSVRTLMEVERPLSLAVIRRSLSLSTLKHGGKFRLQLELGVRTPERVVVIGVGDNRREDYPLPPGLRDTLGAWNWYQTGPGEALVAVDRSAEPWQRTELYWLKAGHGLVRRQEVAWQATDLWKQPGFQGWLMAARVPVPLVAPLTVPDRFMRLLVQGGQAESVLHAHVLALGRTRAQLAVLGLFAAALAWLAWRRQRRLARPWTGAWVAFVFLGGLPGLAGYLVHRRWAPVAGCETCGRRVPRDREACSCCGAPFPAPAATGNEVFV